MRFPLQGGEEKGWRAGGLLKTATGGLMACHLGHAGAGGRWARGNQVYGRGVGWGQVTMRQLLLFVWGSKASSMGV